MPSAALSFIRSLPLQWRGDETGGEPLFPLESPAWARREELFAAKQARRPPLAQRAARRRQGDRFPSVGGTVLAAAVKNRAAARLPLSPVAMGKAPPERGGKEGLSVVRPTRLAVPPFGRWKSAPAAATEKSSVDAPSLSGGDGTSPPDRGQERVSRPPTPPSSRPALRQVNERAHRGRKLSDSAPSGRGGSGPCQLEGRGQRLEGKRPSSHKKGAGADLLGVRPRPLEKRRRENEKSGKAI